MHVKDSAYIAVLEQKLVQSERSLYEFRRIFEHWTKETRKEMGETLDRGSEASEYITQPECIE